MKSVWLSNRFRVLKKELRIHFILNAAESRKERTASNVIPLFFSYPTLKNTHLFFPDLKSMCVICIPQRETGPLEIVLGTQTDLHIWPLPSFRNKTYIVTQSAKRRKSKISFYIWERVFRRRMDFRLFSKTEQKWLHKIKFNLFEKIQ